jgi:hypothetical protein
MTGPPRSEPVGLLDLLALLVEPGPHQDIQV